MKRLLLAAIAITLCTFGVHAQHCNPGSGPGACTPGGPYAQTGFYPKYDSVPCAEIGVYYEQKFDWNVIATYQDGFIFNVDSVHIDSIVDLPCGFCWKTDVAGNTFPGNSTHCIQVF